MTGHTATRATRCIRSLRQGLLAIGFGLLSTATFSQSMVSIRGDTVNMREAPSTNSTVLWELARGYPLQVTKRQGSWVQVKDFEGDTGWVARSLTANAPHHIVKSKIANLRSGPSTSSSIVGKLEYGTVLRTLEKRSGWVRVEQGGSATGWVASQLLWGW